MAAAPHACPCMPLSCLFFLSCCALAAVAVSPPPAVAPKRRAMVGGVCATESPPTVLDADVLDVGVSLFRGCCHRCGGRRASLRIIGRRPRKPGVPAGVTVSGAPTRSPWRPAPRGPPRLRPNSFAERGTFRMEVVGKGDCRSAAGVASTDLTPITCFPAAKFERCPQHG